MLNFVSAARQLPRNDIIVLAKTISHKTVLAMLDSKYGSWVVQDFRSAWYICDKGHVKSWAYIEDDKTDDDNNFVYRELIKAKQEIESLKEKLHKATDVIKSLGIDNCPICNNDNWFNEYDSYPVPKGMLRCSQCGYLKSKYQSEFVVVPRDIYSQLVDARKEIVLLKEQLDSKKETYRLTRKDVLEIVKDEIKNIYPFTFGYFDNSEQLDGQVIPKEATRLCRGFWVDEMGDIVDKKQVRKLEEHYKKYVNKNG